MSDQEIPLSGGNINANVVRVGNTVRRSLTAASPIVHQLLLHLAARGFAGSPRFLGIDEQNREITTFIAGETGILPFIWQQDAAVIAAANLLRCYHDATVDFVPTDKAAWAYVYPDPAQHEVICHNDFAPYNLIYRDKAPIAVIDFDLAGPGPRLRDVAYAAYWLTPLSFNSADQIAFAQADVNAGSRRLQIFCATYGIIPNSDLLAMIDEVLACMGDEAHACAVVGAKAAAKLKQEGHLAHWQRERASYQEQRAKLESNLFMSTKRRRA